jgi:hypothetical protein
MKEKIKELRVKIDGLSQLVEGLYGSQLYLMDIENKPKGMSLQDYTKSYTEMYKCYDSLILAKAWLGKVLQELGESTPYVNDGSRKEVKDIEPAADTYEVKLASTQIGEIKVSYPEYSDLLHMNHIEKVDWLRQEIETVFESWKELSIMGLYFTQVISFEQHIQ